MDRESRFLSLVKPAADSPGQLQPHDAERVMSAACMALDSNEFLAFYDWLCLRVSEECEASVDDAYDGLMNG